MRALIPASLLAVFAFSCGTLLGGTGAWQAIAAHALLLLCALLGLYAWKDPLRLGSRWAWFVWLPFALALLSDALSPVARAGWTGLALIPAFVLLPAAVDHCVRGDEREIAVPALAAVLLAVSAWALGAWWFQGSARPSLPLGHHNLLAAFLVPLLPLAGAVAAKRSWRRWLGIATLVVGVVAVLATRSLDGASALAVETAAVALMWRRTRRWALVAALLVIFILSPRAFRVLSGADPSLHARATYGEAGLAGISRRPALGWGPGAVPWTIGANMRPRLRVNPASEVVGDLHSFPLQWTYELGVVGLVAL
ncbi:MAG TPA: O-antigen ligase family protein, partial [Thermoanaerobaculia bacterium]|nr:O-antigen ligase family protein [Thermoanaerobaculia bacterium]